MISKEDTHELFQQHSDGPVPITENIQNPFHQYRKVKFLKWMHASISTCEPNNCIAVKDNRCLVRNILGIRKKLFFVVQKFKKSDDFFTYPVNSKSIGISYVSELDDDLHLIAAHEVKYKCALFPCNGQLVAYPIRHYT